MRNYDQFTTAQIVRMAEKIMARMTSGMGYQPFGCDWPTLWALHPHLCQEFRDLRIAYLQRGL